MTPSDTLQKRVDDCRERWKLEAKSVLAAYNVQMRSHDSTCPVCPPIIGVLRELAEARERITSLDRSDLAADLTIAQAAVVALEGVIETRAEAESLLTSATDLLNSWAREFGVQEAKTEDGIKGVVNRLWDESARYKFQRLTEAELAANK